MTINFNVEVTIRSEDSRTILERLDGLAQQLKIIIQKENQMATELDALKTQVAANTTVIGSAKDLIVGLKAKLDAAIASGDPAALTALSNELKNSDDALAVAVAANTPADTGGGPTP